MSTKTVADKLLIRPDAALWTSHPDLADARLGPLPAGVRTVDAPKAATVAVVFAENAAAVRRALDEHLEALVAAPVLWVAYPKGNRSDINRDSLWPILAAHGLRPITQIAVDETWSALRFRPLRPDETPFAGGR